MDIGEEQEAVTVEPIEDPFKREREREIPATPQPVPVPERVPVPARESRVWVSLDV